MHSKLKFTVHQGWSNRAWRFIYRTALIIWWVILAGGWSGECSNGRLQRFSYIEGCNWIEFCVTFKIESSNDHLIRTDLCFSAATTLFIMKKDLFVGCSFSNQRISVAVVTIVTQCTSILTSLTFVGLLL